MSDKVNPQTLEVLRSRAEPLSRVLESLGHAVAAIIELVMKAAPLGVKSVQEWQQEIA